MGIKQGEHVTFRAEGSGAVEVLRQIQGYNAVEWFAGDRRRSRVEIRDINGTSLPHIVWQILEAMTAFEEREMAAVYHSQTRRLVVGHILSTHREIAQAAGFNTPASYNRLNLDVYDGQLRLSFAPGGADEDKVGKAWLRKWLSDLFRGVSVEDVGAPS